MYSFTTNNESGIKIHKKENPDKFTLITENNVIFHDKFNKSVNSLFGHTVLLYFIGTTGLALSFFNFLKK